MQKAFRYYDSCTNYELIESARGSPLVNLVEKYGSWNITNQTWTTDSWNFMESLVRMHKDLKTSPLFKLNVEPDLTLSSRYIIMVRYLVRSRSHLLRKNAYIKYVLALRLQ